MHATNNYTQYVRPQSGTFQTKYPGRPTLPSSAKPVANAASVKNFISNATTNLNETEKTLKAETASKIDNCATKVKDIAKIVTLVALCFFVVASIFIPGAQLVGVVALILIYFVIHSMNSDAYKEAEKVEKINTTNLTNITMSKALLDEKNVNSLPRIIKDAMKHNSIGEGVDEKAMDKALEPLLKDEKFQTLFNKLESYEDTSSPDFYNDLRQLTARTKEILG